MTNRGRRAGLSLVEVVVVIGIVGLLVGLTLPAVQKVREAAARSRCQNNLRQLALGLHQYAAAHPALPPGVSNAGPADPFPFMGWHARLLPFLEQDALWAEAVAAYAADRDFLHDPPHRGLTLSLPVLGCPLDPRTLSPQVVAYETIRGLTSYPGVEGTNADRPDGMLYLNSGVRLVEVTDGTSNTLLVGERPPSADMALGWWYAGWGQAKDGEAEMVLGVKTRPKHHSFDGCGGRARRYGPGRLDDQCSALQFWSPHPGGANFAFADGAVRFVGYAAADLLPALATRAAGDTAELP
ncbi:MAG: DUF1559 domain-containing protein [Gemmataceae bacterium]|nr:DUF1559 domain-containing protein [Gemmataceae bacterium]